MHVHTSSPSPRSAAPTKRPVWLLIWLILSQGIGLLTLLPWVVFAGFSLYVFLEPVADVPIDVWLLLLPIWSYPFVLIIGAIVSWHGYIRRRFLRAAISTTVPVVVALAGYVYGTGLPFGG